MAESLKTTMASIFLRIKAQFTRIRYFGFTRYCSLCGSHLRRFVRHHPKALREPAMCPVCLSLERHRYAWTFMNQHTDMLAPQPRNFLHLAPEFALISKFIEMPHLNYITADLDSPLAMVQLDITDIPFTDNEFHLLFCSHVLEHVPDDLTAMAELFRVLSPGGQALIDVPITVPQTFEDLSITDPEERTRLFGQPDHVRRYGPDFAERLRSAGFLVKVIRADQVLTASERQKMRIPDHELLFYCTKPE